MTFSAVEIVIKRDFGALRPIGQKTNPLVFNGLTRQQPHAANGTRLAVIEESGTLAGRRVTGSNRSIRNRW